MRLRKQPQAGAPPTQGDALAEIAQEGGDSAIKLVGDIMERNAAELDRINETLLDDEKRAHWETRLELNALRYRHKDLQQRLDWLLGGPVPDSLRDEMESTIDRLANE